MNFKKSFALSILFVLLALPSIAFAEGFGVYEWSTGGVAMSENYMFAEEDPAVLAYNPAAITRLDGTYFSVGGTFVDAHNKTKFTTLRGVSDHSNNYCPATIPYTYFVKKTADNSWWGLAIFARYGNQIEYDKLWPGRYDTTYSGIKGMTIQPTYGWKVNSKLSAAVGLDINYMGLVMERGLPTDLLGLPRQDFRLDGTSVRLGGVLSFMYDFTENTSA
ncbi:MAG: outer membrane protein transport protein, partial [Synergistaceae bacterium]